MYLSNYYMFKRVKDFLNLILIINSVLTKYLVLFV